MGCPARWEPPHLYAKVEYQADGSVWTQAWTSYQISDHELTGDLGAANLRFGDWLTDDHAWFTARPPDRHPPSAGTPNSLVWTTSSV